MIEKIEKAYQLIKPYINRTNVVEIEDLQNHFSGKIFLKLENLQKSGSFKVRGAINKISQLTKEEKAKGVIAASAGNHAQGVAIAAKICGAQATIVMPKIAPQAKIQATKLLGAKVIIHGEVFDDALNYAQTLQKERDLTFIHPYDDEKIMIGQGTIGLEIAEQLPNVDQIIVPIGGGGLISGIALAAHSFNPKIKIIGVQTQKANAMFKSLKGGKLVNIKAQKTVADGIGVGIPGKQTFEVIKENVADILEITEDEIFNAILYLLEKDKIISEGAGCAAFAAILAGKVDLANKKTLAVISGGNIDVTTLEAIINRALINAGRRAVLRINVADSPGNLVDLLNIFKEKNANLHTIHQGHDRKDLDVQQACLTIVIDTLNQSHLTEVIDELKNKNYIILN